MHAKVLPVPVYTSLYFPFTSSINHLNSKIHCRGRWGWHATIILRWIRSPYYTLLENPSSMLCQTFLQCGRIPSGGSSLPELCGIWTNYD
jgi:hypothetical protein